jgi:hypothetical protein
VFLLLFLFGTREKREPDKQISAVVPDDFLRLIKFQKKFVPELKQLCVFYFGSVFILYVIDQIACSSSTSPPIVSDVF